MGTWTLKGRTCEKFVAQALTLGYRHIDTAAGYDNEEAVGAGLRASGVPRDEIFVTTKVWWTELEPRKLERSVAASLKRLGLGHVDLLLIHWPNPAVPVAESIGALNAVQARGLTRHIGVSNFPTVRRSRPRRRRSPPTRSSSIPIWISRRSWPPVAPPAWR